MLSSIHPLGEQGRNNRFAVTATAHIVGGLVGGASVGVLVGLVGWLTLPSAAPIGLLVAVVAVGVSLDVSGIPVPSTHRQVNERWLDTYRGSVYGFGFGWQLGTAITTILPTWLIPAMFVIAGLSASWVMGLAVGAVFGVVRTAAILTVRDVDGTERLQAFHRSLHRCHAAVRIGALALLSVVGATTLLVS